MKKILFLCLLMLGCLTLFAQTAAGPRAVPTTEKSAVRVSPQENAAALKKIYSNLGTKTDPYWVSAYSWELLGANTTSGPHFMALPFTPKSNSTVEQVQVAVFYKSGDNQVNLSIYADAGGLPGTLLAGPVTVTNLAAAGTCCGLTVASFTALAVTAGTQYWVVADTPLSGTGSDFVGVWNHVPKDLPISFNRGNGWKPDTADNLPAGEVLGTIP